MSRSKRAIFVGGEIEVVHAECAGLGEAGRRRRR